MDLSPPASPDELNEIEARIDAWLEAEAAVNTMIDAVERGHPDERRWFVRVRGEEKDIWTAWWQLRERTFRFETYVMPAPEENETLFYRHLLIRNRELVGMNFEIGDEGAIFLAGSLPVRAINNAELDRILGSMWATIERSFRPALRIGFATRFASE